MTQNTYIERNAITAARLTALVERLSDTHLRRGVEPGWSVGAVLAHLAYWDRLGIEMIDEWEQRGEVSPLPPGGADAVNAANAASWQTTDPRQAAQDAIAAASEVNERIASLSAESTARILSVGRPRLDRSPHRLEHIEQIERALGMTS
jgi:hypothetical protein